VYDFDQINTLYKSVSAQRMRYRHKALLGDRASHEQCRQIRLPTSHTQLILTFSTDLQSSQIQLQYRVHWDRRFSFYIKL